MEKSEKLNWDLVCHVAYGCALFEFFKQMGREDFEMGIENWGLLLVVGSYFLYQHFKEKKHEGRQVG